MKINDSYYTSAKYAKEFVGFVKERNISNVADFCVGGGELLNAAEKRWDNIKCYGTDISMDAVQTLKKAKPQWTLGICDFKDEKSRNKTFLVNLKFDLVLLNPPFTCKGSTINTIQYDGKEYHVSTAIVYIIEALKYITEHGALYSIIPSGILFSKKDEKIRNALYTDYNIKVHGEYDKMYFKDSSPSVSIISIRKGKTLKPYNPINKIRLAHNFKLDVFRGKLSTCELKRSNKGNLFVHTTNLQQNKIELNKIRVKGDYSLVNGPCVLVARVGNPTKIKVCAIKNSQHFVISDCILAIKTITNEDALILANMIIDDWSRFSILYKGTGARYLTIDRLKMYLNL